MENKNQDDMPVIITNLYRIPNDVFNEIAKALDMWQKYGVTQNQLLVTRAWNCLKNPYSTTNEPNPAINKTNNSPSASTDKLKNSMGDFKAFLDVQVEMASGENKNSLLKIQEAFSNSILKNI